MKNSREYLCIFTLTLVLKYKNQYFSKKYLDTAESPFNRQTVYIYLVVRKNIYI